MSAGTNENLAKTIDLAFEQRDTIGPSTKGAVREAVEEALDLLDRGEARVAEKAADGTPHGSWHVNQWLKKAVLLSFRLNDMSEIPGGPGHAAWWDKVPSKFDNWHDKNFRAAGFRAVPGCVVRRSAYIAPGVVLMPSFVNLGAYVDSGTMIDTWSTVGSCAQIGKNCHISGGVGIGGVLEPLQAGPVIVEDNCFIGARSEVAEGVIVRQGAVLSMGVFIGASTKIVDRDSGEIFQGEVPAYSVVVPGTTAGKPGKNSEPSPNLYCAVIVKARRRKDPRQDLDQRTAARLRLPALERSKSVNKILPMDWAYLFNSFDGRIGRQTFWIAMGVVTVAEIFGHFIAEQIQGDRLSAIVDLAFTYPEFAVAAKRGQDRNMPLWLIGAFFAAGVLLDLLTVLGLAGTDDAPSLVSLVIAVPFTVFGLALLVELGLRKGTTGPNRYGPDPLGP